MIYRTPLAPNFSYVIIREDISAQELQQRSPYLYQSILMVATFRDPNRQATMATQLLQTMVTNITLKAEASLDLLQALLVYFSW